MPRYLLQVAYTPEAWAAQLKNPQDRVKIVSELMQRLGGRFESAYFAFGDYDIVAVMDLPDNQSAAAASMVVSAGGSVKAIKTTPLMPVEEGIQAMRKGAEAIASYHPPTA
ncbi:MAG: GYD domain-containing protein [Chloroflexi bacterium]|nr:GYD domain-containing protein [Chloroflexota bacterium]MBV9603443.1 GYD domain-containing protein [Chloroflexota bacterium]